jgi:hypothetical protein
VLKLRTLAGGVKGLAGVDSAEAQGDGGGTSIVGIDSCEVSRSTSVRESLSPMKGGFGGSRLFSLIWNDIMK